jgi:hypothetical protein
MSRSWRRKGNDNASEAGENDESRATWEQRGDNQNPSTGQKVLRFAETLKRQFSNAMKALTHRDDEPKPEARRKKGEDTTGGFTFAARQIMSRKVSLPVAAYTTALNFLSETLDWLNQWHDPWHVEDDFQETYHHAEHNADSLHL